MRFLEAIAIRGKVKLARHGLSLESKLSSGWASEKPLVGSGPACWWSSGQTEEAACSMVDLGLWTA